MKVLLIIPLSFFISGCQMGYLAKSSYYQLSLLWNRQSIERVLKNPDIDAETKRKIQLVQDAKKFAEDNLGLVKTSNYDTFVLLDDRYVVHLITASSKDELKAYTWSFPIVGSVPYKGFFKEKDALVEKEQLEAKNLDVYKRGVSAYSTLGWFADPLLSSMTYYRDEDLVETIIHELTHGTVFVKNNVDFNERLANFVGMKGMEAFYTAKEGSNSPTVTRARLGNDDSRIFAEFITEEIKSIEAFYKENKGKPGILEAREKEFQKIITRFTQNCRPKLKTEGYAGFANSKINNALLIGYKTYYQDLSVFEKAFKKVNGNWNLFFKQMKTLKQSKQPEADLKAWVNS